MKTPSDMLIDSYFGNWSEDYQKGYDDGHKAAVREMEEYVKTQTEGTVNVLT